MIRKLISVGLTILCVIIIVSYLTHRITLDTSEQADNRDPVSAIEHSADSSWKGIFEQVPAFRPSEPKIAAEDAARQVEKQRTLKDGRIIGIVKGAEPRALIIKPGETQAKAFAINDGWLPPWTLIALEADYVTWKNSETGEEAKQYLFN